MENNQKNSNILDDVAKETETEIMSIINEGFEQARKIIEDSENRTKIDINNISTLQKKESEILSRQILGTAEIEKRNTVLKIIEKNINKVFITALKELNKNKDKNYQKSLNSFLTEGVVLLDDSILYVSCNKKDRQLIKKLFQLSLNNMIRKLNLMMNPLILQPINHRVHRSIIWLVVPVTE